MSWLKNKLRNWVLSKDVNICETSDSPAIVRSRNFESRGMNFTIYQAVGGNIMEFACYNEKTDRHETRLHIIPSDQDLGQGIAHIITYEMLRK